jgi:hypothetical protein
MELTLQVPDPELEEKGSGQMSVPKRALARARRLRPIFGPGARIVDAYLRQLEDLVLGNLSRAERGQYFCGELSKGAYEKILEKVDPSP